MMRFNPSIHHRRSIRLPQFDYTQSGAYFVTICAQQRECLFGDIQNGQMRLYEIGRIVQKAWDELPQRFPNIQTDEFVIMPNHVHGIIWINDVGAGFPRPNQTHVPDGNVPSMGRGNPAPTLGTIVAYFKYQSTVPINQLRALPGVRVWQRNYYEHVIRDDDELFRICEYIRNNPAEWVRDENYIDRCQF